MNRVRCNLIAPAVLAWGTALLAPAAARAQGREERLEETQAETRREAAADQAAREADPFVEKAGVGSPVRYADQGVFEMGGSAGITTAADFFNLSLSPQAGWFFLDKVEISLITSLSYIRTGGASSTFFTALAEPSYHFPLGDLVFGFAGAGVGVQAAKDVGAGFAFVPRVGLNFLIGRSGVLTPALSLNYTTSDEIQARDGAAIGVSLSFGLSIGFTVMW